MNRQQGAIIGMVIGATLANLYGAIKKNKGVIGPIGGGLVVATILVAIAESESAATIAELFALAFLITSAAENGTDLLDLINKLVGSDAEGTGSLGPTQTPRTPPTPAGGGSGPRAV